MTYTALGVLFILACVGLGARGGNRVARPWLAASLATAIVLAQFAVLMSE
jgi:hypothetical protein